jgi:hypothetical protein
MLEHPVYPTLPVTVTPSSYVEGVTGDNVTGGDNQQETVKPRLGLDPHWVVGFVDGEGCFSVSVHRNPRYALRTGGWQLRPVFQVYQHERHRAVLADFVHFFGCGRIRPKGPNSRVLTYAVDSMRDQRERIIPFFEYHPLVVKSQDFQKFAAVVELLTRKEHFTSEGFERAVRLAYGMNADGKQRARTLGEVLAGSSETARQASTGRSTKIQSDPHGDMGS